MRIRFTKKARGDDRLTVERDDGTTSQGRMVPGFGADAIPHDLLHALVESRLGLTRGVYGMVNTGLDIAELIDPSRKTLNKSEHELMWSEIVTTMLQGEAAYGGVDAGYFRQGLRRQCGEHALPEPSISDAALRELRAERDVYQRRWRELGAGETLDVDVATGPHV